ncbi:SRPBCC family protein [Methylomonas sp. MO1]|uniref:SRPBCC family protein n=1 Tax=Methylomonas sp. MO1 TaxID=3073619 RepID=UPI0028A4F508|nr:SRPBCC family protein [Methylomonas sp. MO1]MDT4288517.1 SRPBCC family protein [Methylomonas sp. MO1]
MLKTVTISKTMSIPTETVWSAIAGIGGLERWFPVISDCRVIGNGVGATRILTLVAGGEMTDRIELIDDGNRRFQYNRIESPFPVSHYLGTVTVGEAVDGGSMLEWVVDIEAEAISDGVAGLERDLLTSAVSRSASEAL